MRALISIVTFELHDEDKDSVVQTTVQYPTDTTDNPIEKLLTTLPKTEDFGLWHRGFVNCDRHPSWSYRCIHQDKKRKITTLREYLERCANTQRLLISLLIQAFIGLFSFYPAIPRLTVRRFLLGGSTGSRKSSISCSVAPPFSVSVTFSISFNVPRKRF